MKTLIGILCALALACPAHAQKAAKHHVARHHAAAVPVPLPTPRPADLAGLYDATKPPASSSSAQLTAQQVQQNPLVLLQQFTTTDIDNAILLATSNNDTVALPCWQALLKVVQALPGTPNSSNPSAGNPLQVGIATGIQDARDAQALIASLQNPTGGPLAALNTACAPMVVQIQTTLTLLGVGGGVVAAGGPAAATTAVDALNALLLALPKPIIPIP